MRFHTLLPLLAACLAPVGAAPAPTRPENAVQPAHFDWFDYRGDDAVFAT